MSTLTRILDNVSSWLENLERSRREAWLAQSTDIYHLEERIRELERNDTRGIW